MSYELKGMKELEAQLLKKFGVAGMKEINAKALRKGAKEFDKVLKPELETFRDTGATIDEVTYTEIGFNGLSPRITINWRGPEKRYRLVHLNEHGYNRNGKKVKPRGYGAIARALAKGKGVYYEAVKSEIGRGL